MKALLKAWVALLISGTLLAQSTDSRSWDNLQRLEQGQKVRVFRKDKTSEQGTFVSYSAQEISVRVKDRGISVPRAEVARITTRSDQRRLRNMAIGMAVGAGAGAAIALPRKHGEAAFAYYGAAGIIFLAGAIVGLVLPANRTIYRE